MLGPLFGAVVLAVADWRGIFAGQPGRRPGAGRGHRAAPGRRAGAPSAAARGRPDWLGCAAARASRWSPALLVFVQPPGCCSDLTWGAPFVPVRRRRPLADPGRRWSRSWPRLLLRGPLPDRRRGRWSTCAAGAAAPGEADLVGACCSPSRWPGVILAFATADPEVAGLLRRRARGTSLGVRGRRRRASWCTCAAPRRRWCPRGALRRTPAWGALAGQLLRRRGADRGADRHPDLRPDHRLPRLPADGRAGAGPASWSRCRSAPSSAATSPARLPRRRRHRRRHGARGGRLRADEPLGARRRLERPRRHRPAGARRASASAWRWRRSTPPCSPAPTTTVHGVTSALRRGGPDGRHAGRHLGADHDRAAPLLRRAGRPADASRRSAAAGSRCEAFTRLLKEAGIAQEHTVFVGAAVCAVVAGVLALVLFRGTRAPGRSTPALTAARADRCGSATLRGVADDFDDLLAANRSSPTTFDARRLRRHRPRRRRHRDLHGLPDRPAADARPQAGRRQDLPQPRRPGHRRGAGGAGARRAPARRRPDPGRPAHPLRDGHQRPTTSSASGSASRPGRTPPGRRFHVVEDQEAALARRRPARCARTR